MAKARKKNLHRSTGEILGTIPRAQYEAIDAVNYSALKWMAVSPMHYQWALTNKQESSDLDTGSATHTAILEPRRFMENYVVQPETRTNGKGEDIKFVRNGGHWDEFQAAHPGKTILTKSQYDCAWDMQESVRKHRIASMWLADCLAFEFAVVWTDAVTDVRCKGIIDAMGSFIFDLKSAVDPSGRGFSNAAAKYRYHWQAAMYQDAVLAITGKLLDFHYIVAAKNPPIDVVCYEPTIDFIQTGRDQYRDALIRLVECREKNEWPGLSSEVQELDLPAWATSDDVELIGGQLV